MKYIYYLAVFLLLISCESKPPIEVKQIESLEIVKILPNQKNTDPNDSIIISIPTEFEIKINTSVRYITWHYIGSKKTLWNDVFDYQIYKIKPIYEFNIDEIFIKRPVFTIKKERSYLISKNEAIELFKKYQTHKYINNLIFTDTIKLTSYNKFKKENKSMIDNFRKINDSINFTVMKSNGSFFYLQRKINW